MVFRYYKDVNEFDETRMHSDYSVISSEFICFITTIMSSRIVREFDSTPSLENLNYSKSMKVLGRAKKVRIDDEWNLIRLTVKDAEILTDLGLLPKITVVKDPRGRPRKRV